LYSGGLWLAVIITPAAQFRRDTANASTGSARHPRRAAPHARGGERACRVLGELTAQPPSVEADRDTALSAFSSARIEEVASEAPRRAQDHGAVHPVRPRAEDAAEASRSELERAGETIDQVRLRGIRRREQPSISARAEGSGSASAHARAFAMTSDRSMSRSYHTPRAASRSIPNAAAA